MTPTRLNGWRRLWIVWAVVAIPLSMFLTNPNFESTAGGRLRGEEITRQQNAHSRAADRLTASINRELGGEPTDAGELARRASIVAMRMMSGEDTALRAEQAAITADYAPRIVEADRADRRLHWQLSAVVWVLLALGVYMLGALVAWIRRGFQRS
jgi:hypothetical protein